jgi:hypothetical protein
LEQLECGAAWIAVIVNGKDVETGRDGVAHGHVLQAPAGPGREMAEEIAGNVAEVVTLGAIDGGFGGFDGARGAGFHLDEAERVVMVADEVEFAAVIGRAKVAGDDGVAVAAEIEVGVFFAAAAGLEMFGGGIGGEKFGGEPVEGAESGLGDSGWEHSLA